MIDMGGLGVYKKQADHAMKGQASEQGSPMLLRQFLPLGSCTHFFR